MAGFGRMGFGGSPYGIRQPPDTDPNGGVILRDPATNQSSGSRKIDPRSRDYVVDAYGRWVGMNNTQQLVLIAASTKYGSSAMRSLGQQLSAIDRITDDFAQRVEVELRRALAHLTGPKIIEIRSVKITRTLVPGQAYGTLLWKDLQSGQEQTEALFR